MTKELLATLDSTGNIVENHEAGYLPRSISGGPALKSTQVYPVGYAKEVATLYKEHIDNQGDATEEDSDSDYEGGTVDMWEDCGLDDVVQMYAAPSNCPGHF